MRGILRAAGVVALASMAACGGGDGGDDAGGVGESSVEAWLEGGNGGEAPGCPALSEADLGDAAEAEVTWVGNDGDNLICVVALPEGSGGLALYAADGIVPAAEVVPEESPGWALQGDDAVVVTDETLGGDARFVVVADAAVEEQIRKIGAALRANLGRSPDEVDGIT